MRGSTIGMFFKMHNPSLLRKAPANDDNVCRVVLCLVSFCLDDEVVAPVGDILAFVDDSTDPFGVNHDVVNDVGPFHTASNRSIRSVGKALLSSEKVNLGLLAKVDRPPACPIFETVDLVGFAGVHGQPRIWHGPSRGSPVTFQSQPGWLIDFAAISARRSAVRSASLRIV